ncbi:MAG: MBL fold metallo-hydrolase [Candidatus Bathyarchaeota archaeon]
MVLISHGHGDHVAVRDIVSKPGAKILDKLGMVEFKGVKVKGVATFHDIVGGKKRQQHNIRLKKMEKFIHLGDLGHILPSL